MTDEMQAAVFHGPRDVRCERIPVPKLEPGDALLRIRACGICGSDLHTYRHGMFLDLGTDIGSGRVLGHEFSGEVVATEGDCALSVGQRICTVGIGGNAEYVRVPASRIAQAREFADHVTFEEAATTEPLATSLHAVNLANPQDGETHVVMGAGIIGLGIIQCIRAFSTARIIAVDLSDRRLDMARQLGADEVINVSSRNAVEALGELTGSKALGVIDASESNVDTVYDCAGAGKNSSGTSVLAQALEIVRFGGKVVVVAVFEKPIEVDFNVVVRKGAQVLGSWAWEQHEFVQAAELIDSGRVDRTPLISHRFAIKDASDAYETQLQAAEAIKVVFTN